MTALPPEMSVWTCRRYGGPEQLALERRPVPTPGPGEVVLRIHATTVSSADVRLRTLVLPRGFGLIGRAVIGFRGPRKSVLGTECSGTVATVGADVTAFAPGDAVFAFPGSALGCHAEYRVMPADGRIARKPDTLSHAQAASLCFGATTALHFLHKARLRAGDHLLVIGASGAVGSAMVQIGQAMGAVVTAVTSAANADLVQSLGAHRVIDYHRQDHETLPDRYDIIADTVAASSFARSLRVLNPNGRYLSVAGGLGDLLARPRGSRRSIGGPADEKPEHIAKIARMAEAGTLRPVIDSIHAFADLPAAHARAETGRKRGSVVVSLIRGGSAD